MTRFSDSLSEGLGNRVISHLDNVEESVGNRCISELSGLNVQSGDLERPIAGNYSSNYEVNVRTLTSGYILSVGCQQIAVESALDVVKLIQIYLTGDFTVGDRWLSSDKNIQNFIKNNLEVK